MIYGLIGLGLVSVIFFAFWRWEAARHESTRKDLAIEKGNVENLQKILIHERELWQLAGPGARVAAEKKAKEIAARTAEAKPGEKVADIFGTGTQGGQTQ